MFCYNINISRVYDAILGYKEAVMVKKLRKYQWLSILLSCLFILSACSSNKAVDDYATNKGYEQKTEAADNAIEEASVDHTNL